LKLLIQKYKLLLFIIFDSQRHKLNFILFLIQDNIKHKKSLSYPLFEWKIL